MALGHFSYDNPGKIFFEEWDSKTDKEILDISIATNQFNNDSSIALDNGTLYESPKEHIQHRITSDLEESSIQKKSRKDLIYKINDMLKKNGFAILKSSSHGSLLNTIKTLLEYLENITQDLNFASFEEIFKKFLNKKIDKKNKFDLSVINMITVYEMQKGNFQKEIEKLSKELLEKNKKMLQIEEDLKQGYQVLNEMQDKLIVLENRGSDYVLDKREIKDEDAENQEIINKVCKILSLRQPVQIPSAVSKMEKVLRAVPQMESFIKEVYKIVAIEEDVEKVNMEIVVKALKRKMGEFKDMRRKGKGMERCMQTSFEQEVVEHFKHLFEITRDEDVIETMDQVFLFVHELRTFLKSIRSALGLNEDVTVNGILLRLKRIIDGP